jgi:hypothetical protein
MSDPILEEIARVRQELLKKHGGMKGYIQYVRKLDQAHRKKRTKASRQKVKTSP